MAFLLYDGNCSRWQSFSRRRLLRWSSAHTVYLGVVFMVLTWTTVTRCRIIEWFSVTTSLQMEPPHVAFTGHDPHTCLICPRSLACRRCRVCRPIVVLLFTCRTVMNRCPLLRVVFVRQSRRTTRHRVAQGHVMKTPKWMCCTRG
jgi:hypothetical protein